MPYCIGGRTVHFTAKHINGGGGVMELTSFAQSVPNKVVFLNAKSLALKFYQRNMILLIISP